MKEVARHLILSREATIGRTIGPAIPIGEAVGHLLACGLWATPQNLQHAAAAGVVSLPDETAHIGTINLTRQELEDLVVYLIEHQQFNPLDCRHDCHLPFPDLRAMREVRQRLCELKTAADALRSPVDVLDLITDEPNPDNRFALWLSVRDELQRLQDRLERAKATEREVQ